ncbi:cadherin-like beta sandwich domain-containing protein [Chengkuizengella axinellae]|uniref:Cadherin-like beta sandwich domain-containing protein n=1 Tax=Chengkuizengella axinellae TaxID=3064388 RepID=A0ABT9J131_9BACL|nr:cadherin-like beta sandwich domain-containing protein [Chengkuizengella sp. 2205SS18-9]MDP5275283.1 cadherin-like beta sandwich domain-containing protein [Chengkuizengella sp. 2205SS18-9]
MRKISYILLSLVIAIISVIPVAGTPVVSASNDGRVMELSNNADLESLRLSLHENGNDPGWSTLISDASDSQTIWDFGVPNRINRIMVEATPLNEDANVEIIFPDLEDPNSSGNSLPEGLTEIEIKVISEDGQSTKSYLIRVVREAAKSDNADLASLEVGMLNNGELEGETMLISSDNPTSQTHWLMEAPNYVDSIIIDATPNDDNASVQIIAPIVPIVPEERNQNASVFPLLPVGVTEIEVIVTAEDGESTKSYEIEIYKGVDMFAGLKSLQVSYDGMNDDGELLADNPSETTFNVEVGNDVDRITVSAEPINENATLGIFHSDELLKQLVDEESTTTREFDLPVGTTSISVIVTPDSGSQKFYTIHITRDEPSGSDNNANLSSLRLSFFNDGDEPDKWEMLITDASNPQTTWDFEVPNDMNRIIINAIPSDENASVDIIFPDLEDPISSENSLPVGLTEIKVRVTAENESTKIYEINVVRETATSREVWNIESPMPDGRSGHGAVEVNGKIYVIGGHGSDRTLNNKVLEYDPEALPDTNPWKEISTLPTPRASVSIVELDGKIYVIGGYEINGNYLSTVEVYDPSLNEWVKWESETGDKVDWAAMPTPRIRFGVAEVGGKIYAIGGEGISDQGTTVELSTVEAYDPKSNTWETMEDMPDTRYGHGVIEVEGKIFAIGGSRSSNQLDTVAVYDPDTDNWIRHEMASLNKARKYFSVTEVNGKIYAIGGYDDADLSSVEEYNFETNQWEFIEDMNSARIVAGVAVVDKTIYAIGGGSEAQIFNTMESYYVGDSTLSNNADLQSLEVYHARQQLSIEPSFQSDTTTYSLNVENEVESIDVSAIAAHEQASIQIIDPNEPKSSLENQITAVDSTSKENPLPIGIEKTIPLPVGETEVKILVTAEDSETKEYILNVVREAPVLSNNAKLETLTLNDGDLVLSPAFDPNTTNYTLEVDTNVESLTIEAAAEDENAEVLLINPYGGPSEPPSNEINFTIQLAVGTTTIPIIVTAEDGTEMKYAIKVTRKINNTFADLSDLYVNPGVLDPTFAPEETSYTVEVENNVESITVNAAVDNTDVSKTITIDGEEVSEKSIELSIGETIIPVVVEETDGGTNKRYEITVLREDSPADETPPVIQLNGSSIVTIYKNRTYTEQGATAHDNVDGDITDKIVISGNVDTSTTGEYIITYIVTDEAGNVAEAKRTVKVKKKPTTSKPDDEDDKDEETDPVDGEDVTDEVDPESEKEDENNNPADENTVTFEDTEGHWANDIIKKLVSKQILSGDDQGNFNPDTGITRAEFATLIVKTLELELSDSNTGFNDVSTESWYAPYIKAARDAGIVEGISEEQYEPSRIVSRQEMMTMIMRAYRTIEDVNLSEEEWNAIEKFTDSDQIGEWAQEDVYVAKYLELVGGRSNNNFEPTAETLRAEAAVIIYRFLIKLDMLD